MSKTASYSDTNTTPILERNSKLPTANSEPQIARDGCISIAELENLTDEYLLDCEYRQHRPHTIANNRSFLRHFAAFLKKQEHPFCGKQEIRLFLHYLQQPLSAGGKAVRPITARTYYRCLATFFKWTVEEGAISVSPMEKIKAPPVKNTLKEPLSEDQVAALLGAAKNSTHRHRDTAMLLFLLDTGVRAAELCNLKMADVDFKNRSAKVLGKGNKIRMVYWGISTSKALLRYLRKEERQPDEPVFVSDRGTRAGEALTPSGLLQLMQRLGEKAGVKCGCHDWRRTFAVNILNNGANLISVSRMMGHETLEITKGYLALAECDIEKQHRQFSPADRLPRKVR